ncbi:hypothetical protein SCHPADRAFT_502873 [Schizopora paradoxa]|uniref:F-box domain-containing protein n=1 Tax=Schizopora paradoxa TaxID=27342 RepID=A0A0H2S179_9AGAM|nr:hypothetical protein SCHPADRAFT_502873 [Schizopora paradoxa]
MFQELSDDLLYTIFCHTLPSQFEFISTKTVSWRKIRKIAPLNFSCVCRSWRTLILSSPKLWSEISVKSITKQGSGWGEISVKSTTKRRRDYRVIFNALKAWLSLSTNTLLRIHLDLDAYDLGSFPNDILTLFVRESHRWSSFHIKGLNWEPRTQENHDPTLFTLQCSAPLSSLSVRLRSHKSPLACIDLSDNIIDDLSHMEHLSVGWGASLRLPHDRSALRLPRLRYLHYADIEEGKNTENLQYLLSASHNLEYLGVEIRGEFYPQRWVGAPMYFPRLTSLSLAMSNRIGATYLLDVLACPSLRKLEFRAKDCREDHGAAAEEYSFKGPPTRLIREFLIRSCANPLLEELELFWLLNNKGDGDHEQAFKDLLVPLRKLTRLKVHSFSIYRPAIELLTIPREGPQESAICPLLSEIALSHFIPGENFSLMAQLIEEMIVSRWRAGNLRVVSLKQPRSSSGAIKERQRIAECVREGLTVIHERFTSDL